MAVSNLSKLNIFIFFIFWAKELAEAATNYLSDNTVSTHESPQPGLYSIVPRVYYIPYSQKYVQSSNPKYVISQTESQIPVTVTTTAKTLLSPAYKVTLDTAKYISQVSRPPQGNQVSYPYEYGVGNVVSSTAATHKTSASDYYEEPKKYHYGYRVSNPHTGTEFGHSEVNDGLSAKGYYHVLLPDGRLQNVKYWAGPSGYHATITYETQY